MKEEKVIDGKPYTAVMPHLAGFKAGAISDYDGDNLYYRPSSGLSYFVGLSAKYDGNVNIRFNNSLSSRILIHRGNV